MPRLKRRQQLRKGKKRHGPHARERRWLVRHLVRKSGGRCRYCREQVPRDTMTVDHLTPLSAGGLDRLDNLALACLACNQEKGAGIPVDVYIEGEDEC